MTPIQVISNNVVGFLGVLTRLPMCSGLELSILDDVSMLRPLLDMSRKQSREYAIIWDSYPECSIAQHMPDYAKSFVRSEWGALLTYYLGTSGHHIHNRGAMRSLNSPQISARLVRELVIAISASGCSSRLPETETDTSLRLDETVGDLKKHYRVFCVTPTKVLPAMDDYKEFWDVGLLDRIFFSIQRILFQSSIDWVNVVIDGTSSTPVCKRISIEFPWYLSGSRSAMFIFGLGQ